MSNFGCNRTSSNFLLLFDYNQVIGDFGQICWCTSPCIFRIQSVFLAQIFMHESFVLSEISYIAFLPRFLYSNITNLTLLIIRWHSIKYGLWITFVSVAAIKIMKSWCYLCFNWNSCLWWLTMSLQSICIYQKYETQDFDPEASIPIKRRTPGFSNTNEFNSRPVVLESPKITWISPTTFITQFSVLH